MIAQTASSHCPQDRELIAAIRAGIAYPNVHSTKFPSGEIRGQFH